MNRITNNDSTGKAPDLVFSGIFRKFEHKLYTLAYRLTKSDQVSMDITQEVFLKLWEQRDNIESINNMEAWLYRITENKVIDFLRKASADARLKDVVWNNVQEIVKEAELHIEAREYNKIIQDAINQLPPQRKLIYQLNKEDGLSYQEIADQLQISRHTVKNQLYTAVQSVRGFLTHHVR